MPTTDSRRGGPFVLADRQALEGLVSEAGWGDVSLESLDERLWVGDDIEEAVAFFEQTDGGRILAMLDGAAQARLRDALRDRLAPFLENRGLYLPASAWLLTATAP